MNSLLNKHILLGVTGGIAAYKSADLARRLRDAGAQVRVVMTHGATEFITPLTMQAVSGNPVHLHLLDPQAEAGMGHIALARWADAVLVAPASANFMAKLAHGLADDLLSTVCLACDTPIALAPAMNRQMWANPATQANRQMLEGRGVRILGPGEGDQACGEVGLGRMTEPHHLVEMTAALFGEIGSLRGQHVMITAGPTREALDAVRYISNHSSGKMGYAIAAAAFEAGATVTLVSGPVALRAPAHVTRVDVESAAQMYEAVMSRVSQCDIFIGAAAVADYRPQHVAASKIKKTHAANINLALERTPDILASVAALRRPTEQGQQGGPFTVGFAAETDDLEAHAQAKRAAKSLDMIAANWVGATALSRGSGFNSDENALMLFWDGGGTQLPQTSKDKLARQLITIIAERVHAQLQSPYPQKSKT